MKTVVIPTLCMLLLFFASVVAMEAHAEETHPCKDDSAKFCTDVKPGDGKLVHCLKEHESELSGACKAYQEKLKRRISTIFLVCKDDVAKFCTDENPGSGRIFRCLKKHEAELSAACQERMGQRKKITGAD